MKTTCEKMENCQVALTVEMEGPEIDKYMAMGLDHLAKHVTLPGFRKGKAPLTLVEQQVGKQAILQEALEHLIPEAYEEALKTESILAIAEPNIELLKVEPITFKAIVPLKPDVTPGNYRDIKMEVEKKEVTDSDIDQVIGQLKLQFGSLEPVERAVKFDDVITVDIIGKRNGEQILDRKDAAFEVREGSKYPVPGFAEKIVGLSKGEDTEFSINFAEDYEIKEIAGKEWSFSVKLKEVKEMNLPEVNDDFAKNAGADTVEELRTKIKEGMQSRQDEQLKKEFENKLIRAIIDDSKIDFPPVLVEKEIDHIIDEEARNFPDGVKGLENYLSGSKKTLEQHREEIKATAADRVKAYLVTSKIGEMEGITVTDEQVNEHIETMLKGDESRAESVRQLFSMPQPRESLREMIVINKTMDLLTKMVTGEQNQ
jgi:trigger factor